MEALHREIGLKNRPRQKYDYHLKIFGFHGMDINQRNNLARMIRRLPSDKRNMYADLLAAQASTMMGSHLLNEQAVQRALLCFKDYLHDRQFQGYNDIDELTPILIKYPNYVLVFGTQSWPFLNSRIKAASYFISKLIKGDCQVTVCYSGAYAPGNAATIGDEANELKNGVELGLRRHHIPEYQKTKFYNCLVENRSQTTKENIQNIIAKLNPQLNTPCNITLITSSFHIARVCDEFSAKTNLNPFENDKDCQYGIKTLTLIGAEEFNGSKFRNEINYAKQSFFEVYRLLLSTDELLDQVFARPQKKRNQKRATKSKVNIPEMKSASPANELHSDSKKSN